MSNKCLYCGKEIPEGRKFCSREHFALFMKEKAKTKKEEKEITESQNDLDRLKELISEIQKDMPTKIEMMMGTAKTMQKNLLWKQRTVDMQKEYLTLVKKVYPDKPEMAHIEYLRKGG